MKVVNKNDKGETSVEINEDGITLDGGAITWKKKLPSSSVEGLDDTVKDFIDAIDDLQSQIDGEITSWFEQYNPTTSNEPASLWTTDADKIRHEGDLFYNTATGRAFRYIYNSSAKNHEWSIITDEAISKALADAATAQDTADGKRRVFVDTPYVPYDVGDLWAQGDKGELYKCKTAKTDKQTYSPNDWEKATKYTDDTKANEVENTLTSYKSEIATFQESVNSQLSTLNGAVPITKIGENYIISPKIGGGYLYITKDGCSVEIDPSQKYNTKNDKVINVQAGNSDVFYVKRDGSAYFKGKITATSGKIQKGCIIGSWKVGDTKNTGRDGWLSCNSSFNNGVIDSGISWFINDSEHFYNYETVMNGVSFEYYSYGLKPESTILKFRFNSYSDAVNNKNKNCMYANVGYIGLNSTGNIDLNSTGSGNMYLNTYNNGSIYLDTHNTAGSINFMGETHCNSNLILTKPYTKLAGYNKAQTACFDLVQLTEYTSGANHVRLGSETLNTEIYGASIYLKVSSAVYVNDVPVHGSDRNIKKEISSIDEKYDTFFNKLNPVTYKFIDGQSGRFHSGFISQEVEEALIQSGLTTNDFAGFVKYNDPKTNDEKYGLRYEEFISLNTHMIQKLYKRIEFLEEKINSLVDN